jgi:hypothetical protein
MDRHQIVLEYFRVPRKRTINNPMTSNTQATITEIFGKTFHIPFPGSPKVSRSAAKKKIFAEKVL